MALIDDLKQQRLEIAERQDRAMADVTYFAGRLADLTRAIAALEPAPLTAEEIADVAEFVAEQETAREQLEREPEIPEGWTSWSGGECPVPIGTRVEIRTRATLHVQNGIQWTVSETLPRWSVSDAYDDIIAYRIIETSPAPEPDEQDDANEFISDLTGNLAIEPESDLHEERPALDETMQDEREEPVALAQPEWNEPVTSEAKMFAAGIQSEQKPERKFDPFAMFKREDA